MDGRGKEIGGYLTVYLALIMGVMVTLSLVLIEGVRLNTLQLETECIADIGMDSTLAEYHRELFKKYNILALDSSYGTKTVGRVNVQNRLKFYLDKNMVCDAEDRFPILKGYLYKDFLKLSLEKAEIDEIQILTDENGRVFRNEAVRAVKDDLGLTAFEELGEWMRVIEKYQLDKRDIEAEKREADRKIASYEGQRIQINEEEWETVWFENPTDVIENRRNRGILSQVLGEETAVSEKSINDEHLIYNRMKAGKINSGNSAKPAADTALDRFWFNEYLMRYMGCFMNEKEKDVLDYEVEYVIAGQSSDAANLKSVFHRITAIREAANVVYLYSDSVKCSEAEIAALGLSFVTLMPEMKDVIKTAILLGWAYAESIYDMKILTRGGRVPLIKTSENWHYSLTNVLKDMWEDPNDIEGRAGLGYKDYLRVLLMLADNAEMTGRAMNIVEANLRMTPGNTAFRLDGCFTKLKAVIAVKSGFGYRQEITVRKEY